MAVVRWDPFRELAALQNEMSRFASQMWGGLAGAGSNGQSTWLPPLDVWESDDEIVLALDLPGVSEEDVSVEYEDGVLTVTGQRERKIEEKNDRFYRFERRFGQFSRSATLPQGIDASKITAAFNQGVLEIHVPKPEERKPTRIQIGSQGTIEGESVRKK